jgi:nitric oxide reductase subunit B
VLGDEGGSPSGKPATHVVPLGTMELLAAIDNGYWYARSAEFMQQPIVEVLPG